MHQERGLARRRRALERRRRDRDDHPATVETFQHVAEREGTRHRVELVAPFDQSRRRRRVQIGTEGDHQDVGVEGSGVGLDAFGDGIDRPHRRLDEPHPGLDEIAVGVVDRRRERLART